MSYIKAALKGLSLTALSFFTTVGLVTVASPGVHKKELINCTGIVAQVCTVNLGDVIYGSDSYKELANTLDSLTSEDTVLLPLQGNGGQLDGAEYLIYHLQNTKAHVKGEIVGDVYSAHALLAMSIRDITVNAGGFAVFHLSSTTNMAELDCANEGGLDRGLPKKDKCIENENAMTNYYNQYSIEIEKRVLTEQEITSMLAGHDVIVPMIELKRRLGV